MRYTIIKPTTTTQNRILLYSMDYKPELTQLINLDLCTQVSRRKLESIYLQPLTSSKDGTLQVPIIHPKLLRLIDRMIGAFDTPLTARALRPNLDSVRKTLINFDQNINQNKDSMFQSEVSSMHGVMSIELEINRSRIRINFLYGDYNQNMGYMAAILHATHTFCTLYPRNYDGLTITACLDSLTRTVEHPDKDMGLPEILAYLKNRSVALNVSGVTISDHKTIILTKREEVIKLLFHELAHYAGLDSSLHKPISFGWDLIEPKLNLSEGFTEFVAIILTTAYDAIHLASVKSIDPYKLYALMLATETQYSIYLTAAVLKFFGYDQQTWREFFGRAGKSDEVNPAPSPIPIWEYVIVRAQLMVELNRVVDILTEDLEIDSDPGPIIASMKPDDVFLHQVGIYMHNNNYDDNISYLLIDLDWQKVWAVLV